MRCRSSVVLLLAGALGGITPALANARDSEPAVARDGATILRAADHGGDFCLMLEARPVGTTTCADPGRSAALSSGSRAEPAIAVAVPAAAFSVEVRRAGKLLAAKPTEAGAAYTGRRAGKVRFAVVRVPKGTPTDGLRVRALDASGALVEALAVGGGVFNASALVTERRAALSGRFGRIRWFIRTERRSDFAPSVVDLEREVASACETAVIRGAVGDEEAAQCSSDDPQEAIFDALGIVPANIRVEDRCDTGFRLLHGRIEGNDAGLRAVLGDGRTVTARTAALPGTEDAVFALVLPRGAAVRRLEVTRADGHVEPVPFTAPPLSVSCATRTTPGADQLVDAGFDFGDLVRRLPPIAVTGPVATLPGPPPVRVADGPGGTLCVALGDAPFTALGCQVVSPFLDDVGGTLDSFAAPTQVALAVPASVAAVRLTVKGKAPRLIPAVPVPGYSGLYAGRIGIAAADVAGYRGLGRIEYLDATGNVLHSELSDDDDPTSTDALPRFSTPKRIAGAPGRPSLWRTRARLGKQAIDCLALTPGGAPSGNARCAGSFGTPGAVVDVPCSTRRITLAVVVPRRARVSVETAPGRTSVLRLRGGAGLVNLPRSTGLRAFIVRSPGHRPLRVRVAAPAGARQCGWHASPVIERSKVS